MASVIDAFGASTVRAARRAASKAGHDMGRLDMGGDTALAVCRRSECTAVLEVVGGHQGWRIIDHSPGSRCAGLVADTDPEADT
jgi:hypothetical protein